MSYRELFIKENTDIRERYDLAVWRIEQMLTENGVKAPFDDFFRRTADFILYCDKLILKIERDELLSAKEDVWRRISKKLYEDVQDAGKNVSYAFRETAEKKLGGEFGALLSHLYMIIREMIPAVFECRRLPMTIRMELFIEIYNYFEQANPAKKSVSEAIYWFVSDYADLNFDFRIRELFDRKLDYCRKILENSGLSGDFSYLYQYGFNVGGEAIKRAEKLSMMSDRDISEAAEACILETVCHEKSEDNYRTETKKRYLLSYEAGSERLVRAVILKLEAMGAEAVTVRSCPFGVSGSDRGAGVFGLLKDSGCDAGHADDVLMYADSALYERYLSVARYSLEKYSGLSGKLHGIINVRLKGELSIAQINAAAEKTAGDMRLKFCDNAAGTEEKTGKTEAEKRTETKRTQEYVCRIRTAAENYRKRLCALEREYIGTDGDKNIEVLV